MVKNKEHYSVIIIGSGAAGSAYAREFGKKNIKTLILEQGQDLDPLKVTKDPVEMKYNNPLFANPKKHKLFFKNRSTNTTHNQDPPWGTCVGGSTLHFTGNALRFHEEDFKQKTVSGTVAGASLEDWPMTYHDIEKYYEKVEHEIGIAGLLKSNPHAPPQKKDFPLPPYPRSSAGAILESSAKKLGLTAFPAPKFINTKPYKGRGACTLQGLCSSYSCHTHAKASAYVTTLREALKFKAVTLKPNCKALKIKTNEKQIATSVVYQEGNVKKEVFGDKIIVCANSIESVRLLFLSANKHHPNGLLNNNDLLGRKFMMPVVSGIKSLHPHPLGYYGNSNTRRIEDFFDQKQNKDSNIIGGFLIEEMQSTLPELDYIPSSTFSKTPHWGEKKIEFIQKYPNNVMTWVAIGSCLPQLENRIVLNSNNPDHWGLPSPVIEFDFHEKDRHMMNQQLNKLNDLVNQSDAIKSWNAFAPNTTQIQPIFSGGCWMGKTASSSLVDSYGKSHEIKNLYIMGSCIFPTSGRDAPTQTLIALALRSADSILEKI